MRGPVATHQGPAQRNRRSQPTPTVDTFRVYLHYVLDLWFERYGLALHPDKTRLLAFARPRAWTLALERGYL